MCILQLCNREATGSCFSVFGIAFRVVLHWQKDGGRKDTWRELLEEQGLLTHSRLEPRSSLDLDDSVFCACLLSASALECVWELLLIHTLGVLLALLPEEIKEESMSPL
jgi:hypothetical protein